MFDNSVFCFHQHLTPNEVEELGNYEVEDGNEPDIYYCPLISIQR